MSGSQGPERVTAADARRPRGRPPRAPRHNRVRRRRAAVALAAAALLAGCGTSAVKPAPSRGPHRLSVTLDFTPNAVHTGIYLAQRMGGFRRAGVDVTVRVPGSGADGAKLLAAGRTDLAVMDIHDVALARQHGEDLVAVAALVQRPLASLVAGPAIRRPRDLEGRKVGTPGLASDDAVVDQIVRGDGGDPTRVRRVSIGFDAVTAVLGGRVQAATGFWNAEGVALTSRRPGSRVFRLDRYGAPVYPELLVVARRATLRRAGDAVAAFTAALAAGTRRAAAATGPRLARAVAALRAGTRDRSIDPETTARQLRAVRPAFLDARGRAAGIDRGAMRRWAAWEARVGIVRRAPDIDRMVWSRAAP